MQLRETEGALRNGRAQALHGGADRPAKLTEVAAPVGAAPDLVPVDDQRVARKHARQAGGQQREVRKRGHVNGVVAPASQRQMGEHAGAEHERRQDPPAAVCRVQAHARTGADHTHTGHVRTLAPIPLAQRQVGDLVAVGGESLGEVSVPALGAADGIREQAVIDDADTHERKHA